MQPCLTQEQEEIEGAMEQYRPEDGQQQVPAPSGRVEFCQSHMVAHQHREGCMRRHGKKHAGDAGDIAMLEYIGDVLERREAHAHHHGIHDAIKRIIECLAPVRIIPQYQKLTAFFAQRYDQVREYSGICNAFAHDTLHGFGKKDLHDQGGYGAEDAQHEGEQEQTERLFIIPVFVINKKTQEDAGGDGQR